MDHLNYCVLPPLSSPSPGRDADDTLSSLNPRRAPAAARHGSDTAENKENVSESFVLDDTASEGESEVECARGRLCFSCVIAIRVPFLKMNND